MSVYKPDMRVMMPVGAAGWYASHAEYKTERGAQSLANQLLKRKPKVPYHVRKIGETYRVVCQVF